MVDGIYALFKSYNITVNKKTKLHNDIQLIFNVNKKMVKQQ
jgi:hypothetical protein